MIVIGLLIGRPKIVAPAFHSAVGARPIMPFLFIFMIIVETWALLFNVNKFAGQDNALLTVIGGILLVLEIWMVIEFLNVFRKIRSDKLQNSIEA